MARSRQRVALVSNNYKFMELHIEDPIVAKTKELCQVILERPDMPSIRERIEAFLGNDTAKSQYQTVVNKGEALQQKQQLSMPLSGDEIADYEHEREQL